STAQRSRSRQAPKAPRPCDTAPPSSVQLCTDNGSSSGMRFVGGESPGAQHHRSPAPPFPENRGRAVPSRNTALATEPIAFPIRSLEILPSTFSDRFFSSFCRGG